MNFSALLSTMRNNIILFAIKYYPKLSKVIAFVLGYFEYRVWLDDKRPTPPEFNITVQTAFDAITILKTKKVTRISLDHDLGPLTLTGDGYMVACWIEEAAYRGHIPRIDVSIHTDNAARRPQMKMAIDAADKYWSRFER